MTGSNSAASIASTYLDSLISYVLDIKPYRTKFSVTGAVSETYSFSETFNVAITDVEDITLFQGADLLSSSFSGPKVRERLSQSWWRDVTSDGIRTTWPLPQITNPKRSSLTSLDKYVVGTNEYLGIPGLTKGVLSPVRFDGPAPVNVSINGINTQESIDYFVSKGIFSFDIVAPAEGQPAWIRTDLRNVSSISATLGNLYYSDVQSVGGTLTDITGSTYEEFVAICTSIQPAVLTVYSTTDLETSLGTVQLGQTFVLHDTNNNLRIQFTFTYQIGQEPTAQEETAIVGDSYLITPNAQITVLPSAPEETWSLIKTNPISLVSATTFTAGAGQTTSPKINIHTKFLEFTPSSTWTIVFDGVGHYTLTGKDVHGNDLNGYPLTISLLNGCSYKDTSVAFTLNPTTAGWKQGDTFSFAIHSKPASYKVFGSQTGWAADATVGEWYWNGKIGFKIPQLYLFSTIYNSTMAVSSTGNIESWKTTVSTSQIFSSILFSTGLFYAYGDEQAVAASIDGVNWTTSINTTFQATNPQELIIIEGNNGLVLISSDGINFTQINTGVKYNLKGSTVIPHFLASPGSSTNDLNCNIAVGDYGTILTSTNGTDWASQTSNTIQNLHAVTYSSNTIVIVGDNGTILTSPDRLTWTSKTSQTSNNLRAVLFTPITAGFPHGIFTAVGDSGTIIRSVDGGNTWLNLNPNLSSTANLSSIAYGNGKYIAVSSNGITAQSPDGIVWSGYGGKAFRAIAYGNNTFVAVGGGMLDQPQLVPSGTVSVDAIPSTYNITFTIGSDSAIGVQGQASVNNTVKGYGKNLITNTEWSDDWAAFTVKTISGIYDYYPADTVQVYVAPGQPYPTDVASYSQLLGYDGTGYDDTLYDMAGLRNQICPLAIDYEVFPLYHGNGVVIIPAANTGDIVSIDKTANDRINFQITGASSNHPELGAIEDWIPLYFEGFDVVDTNLNPTSNADFSDLQTFIEAFSASTGERVFYILSPRYLQDDYVASSQLVFDSEFLSTYLGAGTQYSIMVVPDASYGQTMQVKMTEYLTVYGRDNLSLTDSISTGIQDKIRFTIDKNPSSTINVSLGENETSAKAYNGNASIFTIYETPLVVSDNYDSQKYDTYPYDEAQVSYNSVIGTIPNMSPDSAYSKLTEGLSILTTINANYSGPGPAETAGETLVSLLYDFNTVQPEGIEYPSSTTGLVVNPLGTGVSNPSGNPIASSYNLTVLNSTFTPVSIQVASETDLSSVQSSSITLAQLPYEVTGVTDYITDPNSLVFTVPAGITAPFRIWISPNPAPSNAPSNVSVLELLAMGAIYYPGPSNPPNVSILELLAMGAVNCSGEITPTGLPLVDLVVLGVV